MTEKEKARKAGEEQSAAAMPEAVQPEAERATAPEAEEPPAPADAMPYIHTGRCRFCGTEDHTGFETFTTQDEADDYVTAKCACTQAAKARARRAEQYYYTNMVERIHMMHQMEAAEREEIAAGAMETLNQLFGTGAADRGAVVLDDEVLAFLHQAAMLVYDGLIANFSAVVAPSVSVKIACKKRTLAVERGQSSKQKLEVV